MATLYSITGEQITSGLDSHRVSDQARKIAREQASARNEEVYIEDEGEYTCIRPDGSYGEVPDWVVQA